MNMNIKKTADNIRKAVYNNDTLITQEFEEFKALYPRFYEMLLNKNMDTSMYDKLFSTMQLMNDGKLDNTTAASEFSTHGAKKYVYPLVEHSSDDIIIKSK